MTCNILLRRIAFRNYQILIGRNQVQKFAYDSLQIKRVAVTFYNYPQSRFISNNRRCSTNKVNPSVPPENSSPVTLKTKLKRAVAEYGSTVIVFHVGISLISLGTCYILVSSGIDMGKLLAPIGASGTVVANAGTFVTAYAIHKVFAPVRISITLASTPFIVRYLRHIGILKKP